MRFALLILSALLLAPAQSPAAPLGGMRDSLTTARSQGKRARRRPRRRRSRRGPSAAARLIAAGERAMKRGQYTTAVVNFGKAAESSSRPTDAFVRLGTAYFHRAFASGQGGNADQADCRKALDAYDTALALDPKLRGAADPFMLFHGTAQCQEALGRREEALKTIGKATRVSRENPMPYLYGALLRQRMKDNEMSSANFYYSVRRAHRSGSYPELAKLVRSDSRFSSLLSVPQNKNILEAFDAVESGILNIEEAKERIRGRNAYRDALTNLPRSKPASLDVDPRDPKVARAIEEGRSAYRQGRYRASIDAFRDALTADAKQGMLDHAQKSMLLESIGTAYRQLGLVEEAIRVLRRSVDEMKENYSAHYQLALSLSLAGRVTDSLKELDRALGHASTAPQLRKTLFLARTDTELAPIRDMPRYGKLIREHSIRFEKLR